MQLDTVVGELEARVNMLEAALHESNAKSNASASAPAHGSLGRTVWGASGQRV